MDLPRIIQRMKPSVVVVFAETQLGQLPFTGEYVTQDNVPFRIPEDRGRVWSKGTGFIVNAEEGLVATAYHIIKDCPPEGLIEIYSHLGGGIRHRATVFRVDTDADVAILQTERLNLSSLKLGHFNDGIDGMEVAFIGFPLKLDFHITHKGIISGKTRIRYYQNTRPVNVFTINSFVNRGNSGGPLFFQDDDEGNVIGIINARRALDIQPAMLRLPPNYQPMMKISGVDPIGLSVDTYNRAVALIGDVGQVGIGFSSSIDYIRAIMP